MKVEMHVLSFRCEMHVLSHFANSSACPQVTLLRIQTCEQYTNCSDCLQAGDPYCGWCSLENR